MTLTGKDVSLVGVLQPRRMRWHRHLRMIRRLGSGRLTSMKLVAWLTLALLIIALVFIAIWDERLESEARIWLAEESRMLAAEKNSYFALMGLFSALSDDPHQVGRKRVQAYELALSNTSDTSELVFEDYPREQRVRIDEETDFLCEIEKSACMSRFLDNADTITALTGKHRVLLDRYHSLYAYPEFGSTATPGLHEPLMPFGLLARLNRLQHAGVSLEFHTGSRLRAIEVLAEDMRFLRGLLRRGDQLILKILAAEMLSRDLHTLSQLLDSKLYLHEHLPDLSDLLVDLTAEERAADSCIRREFSTVANLMLTMQTARAFDSDTELPEWMMKTLYKPNATVNWIFERYRATHELATLPPRQLAAAIRASRSENDKLAPTKIDYVLNPVGTILAEIASPELDRYIPVFADLTGLLRLVRLKGEIRARRLKADEVAGFIAERAEDSGSPYGSTPMGWDPERQIIYFEGLSERRHLHELELFFFEP